MCLHTAFTMTRDNCVLRDICYIATRIILAEVGKLRPASFISWTRLVQTKPEHPLHKAARYRRKLDTSPPPLVSPYQAPCQTNQSCVLNPRPPSWWKSRASRSGGCISPCSPRPNASADTCATTTVISASLDAALQPVEDAEISSPAVPWFPSAARLNAGREHAVAFMVCASIIAHIEDFGCHR